MENSIVVGENKIEADELNTKEVARKEDIWIEDSDNISGDNLHWMLLDIIEQAGTDQLYVRRINNHLEVGAVNKIEIIE